MSNKKASLVLCSALHDPDRSLLLALKKALPVIQEEYKNWIVSVTKETHQEVITLLKDSGVEVVLQENKLSANPIEDNHLAAIDSGVKFLSEGDKLQYTDGDRMIFGAAYFPEEIKRTAKLAQKNPAEYISITRSFEDNQSHHDALVLTEQSFTRAYQTAIGKEIDPGSTAHIFSKEACQFLLDNTSKLDVMKFPHGKWAVLMKEGNMTIDSMKSSGMLGFETPLQFINTVTIDAFIEKSFLSESAHALREARKNNELPPLDALRTYYRYLIENEVQASYEEWKRRIDLATEWINFLEKEIPKMHLSENESMITSKVIKKERFNLESLEKNRVTEKQEGSDNSGEMRLKMK